MLIAYSKDSSSKTLHNTALNTTSGSLTLDSSSCEDEKSVDEDTTTTTSSSTFSSFSSTTSMSSSNPAVGERIRALVEEIDACIALMPITHDRATVEALSA